MLHHVALLVAFDWKHPLISPVVVVKGDGPFEGGVEALEPVFQNVVEADQQRWVKVACCEAFHQLDEIKGSTAVTARLNNDVPATVNRKIRFTPTFKPVQLCTAGHGPGPIGFGQNHQPSTNVITEI